MFREQALRGEVEWNHLLSRRNNRKPDSKADRCDLAHGNYETKHGYRIHWICSTQKAEQDEETRTRRIEKALERLRALQTKLNRYNLNTRQAIRRNIANTPQRDPVRRVCAV